MKEATGEASMTGITIAVIAVVAVIAVPLVQTLISNMAKRSCCAGLGGSLEGGKCVITNANGTKTSLEQSKWWDAENKKCVE